MAKRTATAKPPAPAREHTVSIKLSPGEFQLIDYAASKSGVRGRIVWMRTKLIEAAREKLSDKVADDILGGRATVALLKESLEGKKAKAKS